VSTATTPVRFVRELRDICGAQHVIDDPARLDTARISGVAPAIAVEPGSADEIAAILRFANEHGLSVVSAGGFTQQQAGSRPAQIDVLLHASRLTEVEHYDPADLTVGVGAGCTIAQLRDTVAQDGLLFAADPAMPERATIGGTLASALAGPLRHGYGGLRDYCIGIRFVTGDGRKGKGGGRVVKNVAGYDMMKLLIGSWGTLAVITSASFKLFPAPRQTRTFIAEFPNAAEAIQYRKVVLRSPLSPICLEVVSPDAGALLAAGARTPKTWSICVRASGSDAVLARYRSELGSAISREIDGGDERQLWQAIQNFAPSIAEQHPECVLMTMSLPPAEVRTALDELQSIATSTGSTLAVIGRAAVGQLLVGLWPANAAAISTFQNRLPRDASLAILRCPEELSARAASCFRSPTHIDSMRSIKRALDPNDILNRGRFVF